MQKDLPDVLERTIGALIGKGRYQAGNILFHVTAIMQDAEDNENWKVLQYVGEILTRTPPLIAFYSRGLFGDSKVFPKFDERMNSFEGVDTEWLIKYARIGFAGKYSACVMIYLLADFPTKLFRQKQTLRRPEKLQRRAVARRLRSLEMRRRGGMPRTTRTRKKVISSGLSR